MLLGLPSGRNTCLGCTSPTRPRSSADLMCVLAVHLEPHCYLPRQWAFRLQYIPLEAASGFVYCLCSPIRCRFLLCPTFQAPLLVHHQVATRLLFTSSVAVLSEDKPPT